MRLGLGFSRKRGGGGTPALTYAFGVNLGNHGGNVYYKPYVFYENLWWSTDAKWTGGAVQVPMSLYDANGNVTAFDTGRTGIYKRVNQAPEGGGYIRVTRGTVLTGTPTFGFVDAGDFYADPIRNDPNLLVLQSTWVGAANRPFQDAVGYLQISMNNGLAQDMDVRRSDAAGTALYPDALWRPDVLTYDRATWGGATVRWYQMQGSNSRAFGSDPTEIKADWSARAVNVPAVVTQNRTPARLDVGTGDSRQRYESPVFLSASKDTWEFLSARMGEHWLWGANNIFVTQQSGATRGVVLTSEPGSGATKEYHLTITFQAGDTVASLKTYLETQEVANRFFRVDQMLAFGGTGSGTPTTFTDQPLTGGHMGGGIDGIPFEHILEHASETETRPWYIIPSLPTEAFVRGFVQTVKAYHTATPLPDACFPVLWEWGNEPWNSSPPYSDGRALCIIKGYQLNPALNLSVGTDVATARANGQVWWHRQIQAWIDDEAGPGWTDKFLGMLGGQNDMSADMQTMLNISSSTGRIEAIAVGPYIVGNVLLADLDTHFADVMPGQVKAVIDNFRQHCAIAQTRGLKLAIYEAGCHQFYKTGTVLMNDAEMQTYYRDPRIGRWQGIFMSEIQRAYADYGLAMEHICLFTQYGEIESSQGFGLLEYQGQPVEENGQRMLWVNRARQGKFPAYQALGQSLSIDGSAEEDGDLAVTVPTAYRAVSDVLEYFLVTDDVETPAGKGDASGYPSLDTADLAADYIRVKRTLTDAFGNVTVYTYDYDVAAHLPTSSAYTWLGTNSAATSNGRQTYAVDIGAAAADRYILVCASVQNSDSPPAVRVGSTGGVGGTALTLLEQNSVTTGVPVVFYGGLVPTGSGTTNIEVTWVTADFETKLMSVWRITGLTSTTLKGSGSNNNPTNGDFSVAVDSGDLVFFGSSQSGTVSDFAAPSTPAPNGQHNTSPAFLYTADWKINAAGTLVINTPGLTRSRAYVVLG